MAGLLATARLSAAREHARHTVLVVEDDQMLNDLLVFLLETEGYLAIAAHDGQSALQLARELRPSLISLDLGLPLLTGQSVLDRLAADDATRDIPVVVFSSNVDGLCPTPQVKEVLVKPDGIQQFVDVVKVSLAEGTG